MKKNKIILAFFCVILGIMMVIQAKAVTKEGRLLSDSDKRYLNKIIEAKKENEKLLSKIEEANKKAKEFEDIASRYNYRIENIANELSYFKTLSGYEELAGPGIILTIYDLKYDDNMYSPIFQYRYIKDIISYLNVAEAEAISINGIRYTWHSEFIIGENVLVIDNVIIDEPVEIKAIGNPQNLMSALEFKGGLIDMLERYLDNIDVVDVEEVRISPTKNVMDFKSVEKY